MTSLRKGMGNRESWHFWTWPLLIVLKLSGSLRRAPEVAVVDVRRGFADILRILQTRLLHKLFLNNTQKNVQETCSPT